MENLFPSYGVISSQIIYDKNFRHTDNMLTLGKKLNSVTARMNLKKEHHRIVNNLLQIENRVSFNPAEEPTEHYSHRATLDLNKDFNLNYKHKEN